MRRRRRRMRPASLILIALCFATVAATMTSFMVPASKPYKAVVIETTPTQMPRSFERVTPASYHGIQAKATEPAPEPTPEPTPEPFIPDATEVEMIAKTIWGEARGTSMTEKAAVAWCILNRVDSEEFPDTVAEVIVQKNQFAGYSQDFPATEEHIEIAADVMTRWNAERDGAESSGRVLPADYLFFTGDGQHNHFRKAYRDSGEYWDWSLESPYEIEKGE